MVKIDQQIINTALKAGKLIEHKEEIRYFRFREGFGKIPRGTIILPNRVIFGFPHIPRVFTLEKGIEKNISGHFYIEEKIDGFNVRVVQVAGSIFAFSRGGFLDSFVTEKVNTKEMKKFFSKFPDYVLCGEMIGNTPYTQPASQFDVKLFIFDIDRGDGSYVPCDDKYALLSKYSLLSVPMLGKFKNAKPAMQIAMALLKAKKEGMVIKSSDRTKTIKFVTPYADIQDIANNFALLFDMPSGFFVQRVLRSSIFIKDFDLDQKKFEQELGKAFYEKFIEKLRTLENDGEISEEFEILIKNKAIWQAILKHTSREVKIEKIFEKEENGQTRIRFKKIYKKTTKKLLSFINGKAITD